MPNYNYNVSNELTSDSLGGFTYDANGNTLSDPSGKSYSWDFENRLTSVVVPGTGTVSFRYDPFGRRIEKISPTTTSIFAYDESNLIETASSSGSVVARYTQGWNIDEPLAMQRGSMGSFYEADGLSSITSLSNAAGALAQTYTYDSFGNTTNSSGSLTNFFRYTAREFDTESNLYFNRARYLDPSTGRFISEDPIGLGGGINFYRYADNNSVIYTDPFGFTCHCTYHQATGQMDCTRDDGGRPFGGNGYSGHGPGLNNPGQQGTKYYPGVPGSYGGPIPVGSYGIGPPTTLIGPLTIPLTPLPGTNTFGRNGFYIHGDNSDRNNSASEGCIVLPPDTRRKIAGCGGGTVQVVP